MDETAPVPHLASTSRLHDTHADGAGSAMASTTLHSGDRDGYGTTTKRTLNQLLSSLLSSTPFAASASPSSSECIEPGLRTVRSISSFDTAAYSLVSPPQANDEIGLTSKSRRFLSRILAGLSTAPATSTTHSKGKAKRKARSSYYFDALSHLDLPLDGEEGELIDDEGCFVDAKETIGMDIISSLPSELALGIFLHLDVPSVIACSVVSKYWRIFALDGQVWKGLFMRNRGWRINAAPWVAPTSSQHAPDHRWVSLYKSRKSLQDRWADPSYKPHELKLVGHNDSVYCLEIDSRLNILVTGSRDRTIKIWELSTGALLTTLDHHHAGSVLCLKFDFSGSSESGMGFMVSGSSDRTVRAWNVDLSQWIKNGASTDGIRPNMRGMLVRCKIRKILEGHVGGVLDLKIDQKWIVSCSKDSLVRIWCRETLELYASLSGHEGPVNAVGLQGGRVVSASGDGRMILWDLATKERLRVFQGHDRGLACVEFKNDYIISGSNDRKIKLWSAHTGECLITLSGHELLVRALSFDSASGKLLSASYDRTVKVWDVVDGSTVGGNGTVAATCARKFEDKHASHVFDVKFDAKRIVSSSHDQSIMILDFGEGLDTSMFI
ncbi:hypothetical protein FRB94_006685 [Tulasnella sp. JGI-2019a]|nr:hypothetical protein FRB93_008506 [Tulasnella sp. JGI-2019a]KAG8998752.1 hypothetical protein FRB94_006685 [Tulasnella sp. JGI-2019a]